MDVIKFVGALSGILKSKNGPDIDSAVFKLHYKFTTTLLMIFCFLVTCSSLIGAPIRCVPGSKKEFDPDAINTFCWIHTTFTLSKHLHNAKSAALYPGIGNHGANDEKVYHAYYQWVPFMLFFQGLLFYISRCLWKSWEGRKMHSLAQNLSSPLLSRQERKEKVDILVDYLYSTIRRHNVYAFRFFFCEVLNVLISLLNMWILDMMLGGKFYIFGAEVVSFLRTEQVERTDPLIVLFPKMTKCTFRIGGPSGSFENHDYLCILAINIINEKIFIFLWFWFIILTILGFLAVVYRVLLFAFPPIRYGLLKNKAKLNHLDTVKVFSKYLQYGDWFVLYMLSKNIELVSLTAVLDSLYKRLSERRNLYANLLNGKKQDVGDEQEQDHVSLV